MTKKIIKKMKIFIWPIIGQRCKLANHRLFNCHQAERHSVGFKKCFESKLKLKMNNNYDGSSSTKYLIWSLFLGEMSVLKPNSYLRVNNL